MKTADDLRKQFLEETGVDPGNQIGFLAYVDWIEKRLTQQNTLNRDKVEEIMLQYYEINHPDGITCINKICSLAVLKLSEEDIELLFNDYSTQNIMTFGQFKAAIKQLTNKK